MTIMKKVLDRLTGQGVKRDKEMLEDEERACEKEQTLFLLTQEQREAFKELLPRVTQVVKRIENQNGKGESHV
ncbi:hypothetical protein LCGC14_1321330 [marine sediment metagenome]|uniref:Uncharacterized protein n=1 Tax=marine sediment metagenome TaxID=412755 RepID=A0A0F9N085_9ZZZZ